MTTMRLSWHSVERPRGGGIQVDSDDGLWSIIQQPWGGWCLYRRVDQTRFWAETACFDEAMRTAQDTVDEEERDEEEHQWLRNHL